MGKKTLTVFGKFAEFDDDTLDKDVSVVSNQYVTTISYLDEPGKRPKIKLKKNTVLITMED